MNLALLLSIASLLPQPLADQTCLATTVYLESRGQPTLGQYAVAEVALRRQENGRWGKSVCEVVTAPKQFAPTLVPKSFVLNDLAAWKASWKVARQSIENWSLPKNQRRLVVPQANHFATTQIANNWTVSGAIHTIGDHAFYAVN